MAAFTRYQIWGTAPKNVGRTSGSVAIIIFRSATVVTSKPVRSCV